MERKYGFQWADTQPQRIDPEFKAKWLKALRSGEYKQARGSLRMHHYPSNETRYCCLGVAGDLCVKAATPQKPVEWSAGNILSYWSDAREDVVQEEAALPAPMRIEFGFTEPEAVAADWRYLHEGPCTEDCSRGAGGYYRCFQTVLMLTDLNDNNRLTFAQIADVIDYFL